MQYLLACTCLLSLMLTPGCEKQPGKQSGNQPEPQGDDQGSLWRGYEPFVAMDEGPTYHLLDGYDPKWMEQIKEGVELSRAYWGSYGPVHIWILGREDGQDVNAAAEQAFIDEYCAWRTATTERTIDECLPHAEEQFLDVLERGDPEAYLSVVRETDPHMAELVFINVHNWYFDEDQLPDPVLRGIHEYTHVFQQSVGRMPTWMMEGGALFSEAWLPSLEARRAPEEIMRPIMIRIRSIDGSGVTIADMEEIETAPEHVAKYYQELAYYSGAWATAFIIHSSPTRSVSAMRDEFFPLVADVGWETALPRYLDMQDKAEFYEAFEAFMKLPLEEQLAILGEIRP